jgi:hypothetical protein
LRINLSIDYNITIRRDSGLLEQSIAPKSPISRFLMVALLRRLGECCR